MNDLEILRAAWGEPEAPADASYAAARTALLDRAADAAATGGTAPARRRMRARLPGAGVRLAAVGVLAAAIAAGVTVVQTGGGVDEHGQARSVVPGVPAGPVANASEALERAAVAAEGRPFTAPRPDQWIYTESRSRTAPVPNAPVFRDPGKDRIVRHWMRADGKKAASLVDGRVEILGTMPTTPPSDYPSLAVLPTDPNALLEWAHKQAGGLGGTEEGRNETAYSMLGAILRDSVLPPKVEASLYRAIKQIPGVRLDRATDAVGRPAIALGRLTEGWLQEELLLDPKTYAYLGERSVAVKNHTGRGLDASRTFKKGDLALLTARLKAGFVDAPGRSSP